MGGLMKWATKERLAEREKKLREDEEKLALAPVASLMYEEVERRIDVFVFRCCFAHSVYEARRMVIHGNVLLNGKKVRSSALVWSWKKRLTNVCSTQMRIRDWLQET